MSFQIPCSVGEHSWREVFFVRLFFFSCFCLAISGIVQINHHEIIFVWLKSHIL